MTAGPGGGAARVRAVVVNHDGGDWVLRSVASLVDDPLVAEVVVVDNASSDGSPAAIEQRFPVAHVVRTGRNLGFGAGVNVAVRDLRDIDAVALLNPDAAAEAGWLGPLLAALEDDHRVGAACPKIVLADRPGVVNNAGVVVDRDGNAHDRGYGEPASAFDEPCDVPAWSGGAVLLRTAYLADAGLFDERFFLYFEDVELSLRGAALGWRYRYVPASVVRHGHGRSTGLHSPLFEYENAKNRLLTVATHGTRRGQALAWARFGAGVVRRGAGELVHRRWSMPRTRLRVRAGREAWLLHRRGQHVERPLTG